MTTVDMMIGKMRHIAQMSTFQTLLFHRHFYCNEAYVHVKVWEIQQP